MTILYTEDITTLNIKMRKITSGRNIHGIKNVTFFPEVPTDIKFYWLSVSEKKSTSMMMIGSGRVHVPNLRSMTEEELFQESLKVIYNQVPIELIIKLQNLFYDYVDIPKVYYGITIE